MNLQAQSLTGLFLCTMNRGSTIGKNVNYIMWKYDVAPKIIFRHVILSRIRELSRIRLPNVSFLYSP